MIDANECELLAPAGCMPSLHAAIENKANAVYFGLAQLNMRARSRRSFHLKDIATIANICQENNIKSYLTLNTLLYQHDLQLAKKLLLEAKKHNITGAILSDLAAVKYANEIDLEVHLSTQLSLSNIEAIKFYAPYCDRVVLARELNLQMIQQIYQEIIQENICGRNGKLMELEAFAHGALCIAVSGRCGMSLFTSNASANRGACEQNCRKEYIVSDVETGKKLKIDNNFVMSPEDISTIDFLDKLLESGIKVLKIEGRGRSPEYVATTIRAYRKALDLIAENNYTKENIASLYDDLKTVYNRGLSSGYYLGKEQTWSQTYGSKANRKKVYLGKITNYFKNISVAEVKSFASNLKKGDKFLIIGETSAPVEGVIEEIRLDEKQVDSIKKGDTFSIKIDKLVRRNDNFYLLENV